MAEADGYVLSGDSVDRLQQLFDSSPGGSVGFGGGRGGGRQVIHVVLTASVPDSDGYYTCSPCAFNGYTWDVYSTGNTVCFGPNDEPLINGHRYLAVRYGTRDSDGASIYATAGGAAGAYVKITAHTSGKYGFSEYYPNSSGTPTIVTGGLTGTVSAGYLQDIQGFADSGLINKFCQILPNKSIPGCWVMGPWNKKILTDTVAGAITISSTCNPETGAITNVVSQADPTVTSTTIYFIGG